MPKTDKELTVDLVSAYLSAWFSKDSATLSQKPLDGQTLKSLIDDAYNAIHSLPEGM